MIPGWPDNTTRCIGLEQGYIGLPIRDVVVHCTVNGPNTPAMQTVWQPMPDEMERIAKGAGIIVQILGTQHPPLSLSVGEPPE